MWRGGPGGAVSRETDGLEAGATKLSRGRVAGRRGPRYSDSGETGEAMTGPKRRDLQRLERGAASLGIRLSARQIERLRRYAELLSEWNGHTRLVADATPSVVIGQHLVDSLSCVKAGCIQGSTSLVDLGSGAGLPGMPLAVALDAAVTLVESVAKKAAFLRAACKELGLSQVEVVVGRAEDLGRGELREQFDCAVARAVGSLPVLLEYAMPLVRKGGWVIAQKGSPSPAELRDGEAALAMLGGGVMRRVELSLEPWVTGRRCLVVCQKAGATPSRFPRKPGVARKKPLRADA